MKSTKTISAHVRARRATPQDGEVGLRIRARRLEKQLSQTGLADLIGVTFQQVQKYEKGVNRVGAGRLQRIAEALDVPVSFFFDGVAAPGHAHKQSGSELNFGLMQTSGAIKIVQAFAHIRSRKLRHLLVAFAEELAAISSEPAELRRAG